MKRLITASCVLAFLCSGVAVAKPATAAHKRTYLTLYDQVRRQDGARIAGCNLIGRKGSCHTEATDARVLRSIGVLYRIEHPAPPASYTTTSTYLGASPQTGAYAVASSGGCGGITPYAGGGGCWAIPWSIVSCESGGQNVPNRQHSGANGYYQLEVGGTSSRSEQDLLAYNLWAGGSGGSNWSQCGG